MSRRRGRAAILALAAGLAVARAGDPPGRDVDDPAIEALGPLVMTLDLPLALVRPADRADLASLGVTVPGALPDLVLLARADGGDAPDVRIARPGGEAAVVVTWVEPPPGQGGGGIPAPRAWALRGAAPLRVLLRRLHPGGDPASAPDDAGPERPAPAAKRVAAPRGPGVFLDPLAIDLGVDAVLRRYRQAPPAGLSDPVALLLARPTASGRGLGPARAAPLPGGGLRVRVPLPLDEGATPWGPRSGDVEALAVDLTGAAGCEWLLEVP